MFYTDDPVADYERYDAEQEAALVLLPVCCDCGEHIQDEEAYYINDEWMCQSCMSSYLRDVKEGMG